MESKNGSVISARDVIFDQDEVFDGNADRLRNDFATMSIDGIAELLNSVQVPSQNFQTSEVGGPSWTRDNEPYQGDEDITMIDNTDREIEGQEPHVDTDLAVEGSVEPQNITDSRVEGLVGGVPSAAVNDSQVLINERHLLDEIDEFLK